MSLEDCKNGNHIKQEQIASSEDDWGVETSIIWCACCGSIFRYEGIDGRSHMVGTKIPDILLKEPT